jgi:hypothetical protein
LKNWSHSGKEQGEIIKGIGNSPNEEMTKGIRFICEENRKFTLFKEQIWKGASIEECILRRITNLCLLS